VKSAKKSGTSKRSADAKASRKAMRRAKASVSYHNTGRSAPPPERHAIDVALGTTAAPISATASPAAGALVLLNGIAAGDDINMRNGREAHLTSVELRGIISNYAAAAATAPSLARVLIVYDNAPNGAQPAIIDILADTASTAHSDTNPAAFNFNNLNNRDRFKILAQETFAFGAIPNAANAEQETSYPVSFYRKINLPQTFKSDAAGIGSITKGALFALIVGSTTAATSTTVAFCGMARVRFSA